MPIYKAPVEDVSFLLNDVFHIERYANLPGFADASPDRDGSISAGWHDACRSRNSASRTSILERLSSAESLRNSASR